MRRRQHAGWVGWYFKNNFEIPEKPHTAEGGVILNDYTYVYGLKRRYINLLIALNNYHKDSSFNRDLSGNVLFGAFDNFALDPILHENYDSAYLKSLAQVRLIASRSKRGRLMARCHAAYGQSSWHGARSPQHLNQFLHEFALAFENDLFVKQAYVRRQKEALRRPWSKGYEMRMRAQMRHRRKGKLRKKFKKFGERQLAKLKKRKSLWK